jgi:hypothetical protein
MPHLDIVVAALWPGEALGPFLADVKRTVQLPHTLHVLDASEGRALPQTLSSAWNDLAANGKGDLIAFMRTDVALSPGWDVRLSEALEAFPQVGVVIPAFFGNERPIRLVAEGPPTTLKEGEPGIADMAALADWAEMFTGVIYLYEECNAPFSAAVMQRSTWQALSGFDERFRVFGHDHDFQDRMNKGTGQIAASVRSCPVYSKTGMASMESIMQVHADLGDEYAHMAEARKVVAKDGPWHNLKKDAREAVRLNPKYSKLPLSRYAVKLIQRKKSVDVQ